MEVLQCLLGSFRYLHDDNDAHERGEVISITRRLLRRLENSRAHLWKKQPRLTEDEDTLRQYDDFLRQLGNLLLLEMDPGVSYQRHILALHTLQLLLQVAPDPSLDSQSLAYSLSNLILDPFDDVRSLAATLLKDLTKLTFDGVTPPFVFELLRDVEGCRRRLAGTIMLMLQASSGPWSSPRKDLLERHKSPYSIACMSVQPKAMISPQDPASGYMLHFWASRTALVQESTLWETCGSL